MNAPPYTPDVTEFNELNVTLRAAILNTYSIWQLSEDDSPYKDAKAIQTWQRGVQGLDIRDIDIVKGMVQDILGNEPDYGSFITFLIQNLPSHLQASWPEPSHATICALLESMHNRLTKLELGAAFKTK